jgi:superfamily II DNA or RNA helicase
MASAKRISSHCAASSITALLAEHQREAVRRCVELLDRCGGVLLADDVGLGKSFVAAAVAKRFSGDVELIVPRGIVTQWRETLRSFDLHHVSIETHDALARSRFVPNPATPRLVIVDEAHAFRNPQTARYDALARRTVAARVLLVTATPLCNSARDLHALLRLAFHDDVLSARGVPSIDLAFERGDRELVEEIVAQVVIRRDRSLLPDELQFGALDRRVVRHRVPDAPIDALEFPLTGSAALLRRFLRRRLESSEAALIESVRRQLRFYERVIESGRALSKREYRRAFAAEEESESFQQILFWDLWAPKAELDVDSIRAEMRRLHELRAFAEKAPTTKRGLLASVVTGEPTLIFTGSAATARDLARFLRCGLATARDGRGAVEAFQRGTIDTLVTTDIASEGLNLQRAAVVVHYDIPWNPVKLDQRNGRAHRIGQLRDSVQAIYFLPDRDDTRIIATVAAKNRIRRAVLKPSAGIRAHAVTTLRPHVPKPSAIVSFAAAERRGFHLPEFADRRHKAGVERLLDAMSREYLDARRIAELLEIMNAERYA